MAPDEQVEYWCAFHSETHCKRTTPRDGWTGPCVTEDDRTEVFDWLSYAELLRPYELYTGNKKVLRHDGRCHPDPRDTFAPCEGESFVPHPLGHSKGRTDFTESRPYVRVRPAYDALGRCVVIKVVKTDSSEMSICRYLKLQREGHPDERDHTIPILDIIPAREWSFIVMPEWGSTVAPYDVGEQLDCLRQLLEGVTYLHEHRIGHRDLSTSNYLLSYGGPSPAWGKPFMSTFPARFGLFDFGYSTQFPIDLPEEQRLTVGAGGTPGFMAPELSKTVPYDPFKVDIYALGFCILFDMRMYSDISPVTALVNAMCPTFTELLADMTQTCPECRPTAAEALTRLEDLISRTPDWVRHLPGGDWDAGVDAHELFRTRMARHFKFEA